MAYIGNQPTSVAFVTDLFSGNGSTTAFTMSVAPANTASILVAVSGVVQSPDTYSINATTLTFSAAPPTGTGNISVRYLGIPATNVTTTAYRTVTEFTATASQTTFSVPSYTVGYVDVYRNGVRLGTADYTATSGTSVVLANAATLGDLVTTESFYVSSVLNAIPATGGAVNNIYLDSGNANGTGALLTPSGTTAQRPAAPTIGMQRWNSSLGWLECWTGSVWEQITSLLYNVSYLVVAGGAGGGSTANRDRSGGGGGAGGMRTGSDTTLTTGELITVTVGAGGTGGTPGSVNGAAGASSIFKSITSTGGGFGAGESGSPTGGSGGSGGGGRNSGSGGSGTSGQGSNGGAASIAGGGGGGKSAVGGAGGSNNGGAGGAGEASLITGTSVTYAGGGGGGSYATSFSAAGGAGGGGAGGGGDSPPGGGKSGSAGQANTGGGGGGTGSLGSGADSQSNGGNGGSGIVIISYAGSQRGTGGTVTTSGGYTIHTFTSSGTYTA